MGSPIPGGHKADPLDGRLQQSLAGVPVARKQKQAWCTTIHKPCKYYRTTMRPQANSKTMPIKMSAKLRPAHRPKAPQPRRKHSQAPSGRPMIQYAVKWQNIGVRVSPAPRRAPVATVWLPSNHWKAAAAARQSEVLRITVSSGVNITPILRVNKQNRPLPQ